MNLDHHSRLRAVMRRLAPRSQRAERREAPRRSPIRASLLGATAFALLFLGGAPAQAQEGSLITIFEGGNGFAGNTFDLEVLPEAGVVVKALDVNVRPFPAEEGEIEVFTRPGTAVGFEGTAEGWTSRGTAVVTSAGENNPTFVPLSFPLPQGSRSSSSTGRACRCDTPTDPRPCSRTLSCG